MPAPSDISLVLVLAIGGCWAADRVSSKDGDIILEDTAAHTTALTQTGLDSDPWLSADGHTVVFLRQSAEDMFHTAVYEMDIRTRKPRLLYAGPAKYNGRESSYFGRPELNKSEDTLFLLSKEYATEGALLGIQLANGQTTLISDHVVGYDVVACPQYRGDLIALKRQEDILHHPYFLYWLYSPLGKELRLAGGGELDPELPKLRDGDCEVPEPLPSTPSTPTTPHATDAVRIEESVMERRLATRVDPIYPSEARSEHIQGDVRLQVRIDADGTVRDVSLVSGSPQLAGAAIAAVKQWRYRPMVSSGRPVPVVTTVKVPFRLPSGSG